MTGRRKREYDGTSDEVIFEVVRCQTKFLGKVSDVNLELSDRWAPRKSRYQREWRRGQRSGMDFQERHDNEAVCTIQHRRWKISRYSIPILQVLWGEFKRTFCLQMRQDQVGQMQSLQIFRVVLPRFLHSLLVQDIWQ